MGMPVADPRPETLIRRPHVGESDAVPLRQLAFSVGCLNAFGDLVRGFTLHPKSASQLVIRHDDSRCFRVETDGRTDFRIIDDVPEFGGGIGRRRPPTHDHAYEAVITFA